ncbi:MAG: hypothetical protein MI723_07665 [Caulobacterales bacterium]|nr:hypothetical protein [Caulobacterales bacterium]
MGDDLGDTLEDHAASGLAEYWAADVRGGSSCGAPIASLKRDGVVIDGAAPA